MKKLALALVVTMASSLCAVAAEVTKSPPAAPYQQVSKLVKLPDFLPGMGQLFVDPTTLPAGPFRPRCRADCRSRAPARQYTRVDGALAGPPRRNPCL